MEMLLESVEGLGESVLPGELWELLQAEKESIAREVVADGTMLHNATSVNECEPWDDATEQSQRRHRRALETRLREVNEAQDRLIDGGYGLCADCGAPISDKRLVADPAAALCIQCQQAIETETFRRVM